MPSPISVTTVEHHRSADGEHWTVLIGTTVIAQCTSFDQATDVADALNEAKRIGDEFDAAERSRGPAPSVVAPSKPLRCQGLDIALRRPRPQALEPHLPPSA